MKLTISILLLLTTCLKPDFQPNDIKTHKVLNVTVIIDNSTSSTIKKVQKPDIEFYKEVVDKVSMTGGTIRIDYIDNDYADNDLLVLSVPLKKTEPEKPQHKPGDFEFNKEKKLKLFNEQKSVYDKDKLKFDQKIKSIVDTLNSFTLNKYSLRPPKEIDFSDIDNTLNLSYKYASNDSNSNHIIIAFSDLVNDVPNKPKTEIYQKPNNLRIFRVGYRSSENISYLDGDFERYINLTSSITWYEQ